MFLRMVYDEKLAQAAYVIGCQRTGEAVVVDPERDVDRYVTLARANGLRITAVTETHIHADFLSGSRELAERTGARLYLSDEGGPDWKYAWLDKKQGGGRYDAVLLKDGASFRVGNIELRALHTPGHTPEHVCFLVTDHGGGASEPMGILTGDFVFVGDLGRPDLLETAAGIAGVKEASAHTLFASLRKFNSLPDYLQVWPAHGAGSACGKALGAVPQSTVGYERRFNQALSFAADEPRFVEFILEGQPEPPLYFARMKVQNRDGVPLLGELPAPRRLTADELARIDGGSTAVIDVRPWPAFRDGHVPGSIWTPTNSQFPMVTGSYVKPEEAIVLVCEPGRVEELTRDLVRIGLDRVEGWAAPEDLAGLRNLATTPEIDAATLRARLRSGEIAGPAVLDVRRAAEHETRAIPGAVNIAHTRLPARLDELPRGPMVVHCAGGVRSASACSLLQRLGNDVTNLAGGMGAWEKSGGETVTPGRMAAR